MILKIRGDISLWYSSIQKLQTTMGYSLRLCPIIEIFLHFLPKRGVFLHRKNLLIPIKMEIKERRKNNFSTVYSPHQLIGVIRLNWVTGIFISILTKRQF